MRFGKIGFFAILILLIIGSLNISYAQSLGTADSPPRLRELEALGVQLVYFVWGVTGLIFTVLLMIIGGRYMLSAGDQQKQQALKEKGKNWLFGLVLIIIAYPIVLTFYNVTGIGGSSDCYKDVKTPGFHFFFPTICTDPEAESKNAFGQTCNAGDDLGSSGKCCLGSPGLITPVGAGVRYVTVAPVVFPPVSVGTTVYTYAVGAGNVCSIKSTCTYKTPGCTCSYTVDNSLPITDSGHFTSSCK